MGLVLDVYLWEPVGALISTVLSQMILGSRVYAVCCLYRPCFFFFFLTPHHDSLSQIFAQNKAIAVILGLTLVVEVVVGGISISTTSPPPPSAAPAGLGPPCGAVMGPFGWLVAFWVGKTSGKSIL